MSNQAPAVDLAALRIDPDVKRRRSRTVLAVVPLILLLLGGLGAVVVLTRDGGAQRIASSTATPGGTGASANSAQAPALPTPAPANTAASAAPGAVLFQTSGYIIPRERIEISPRFQATVAEIIVGKGDFVRAGELLVRLEDEEYLARVAAADAQVKLAQAQLEELRNGPRPAEIARARASVSIAEWGVRTAEAVLRRRRDLFEKNSASQEQLDEAERAKEAAEGSLRIAREELRLLEEGTRPERIAQAEATLASAKAQLATSQVYLGWCTIKAPITGTILTREVEPGELVTPQSFGGSGGPSTSFLSMADLKDLQVQVDLNEQFTSQVALDQLCEVAPLAYPDKKYVGYVFEIAPEANRAKGTLEIKVQIIDPDAFLTPELSAQVAFKKATFDGASADRLKRKRRTQ